MLPTNSSDKLTCKQALQLAHDLNYDALIDSVKGEGHGLRRYLNRVAIRRLLERMREDSPEEMLRVYAAAEHYCENASIRVIIGTLTRIGETTLAKSFQAYVALR